MNKMPFIVIEGVDGVGKSTVAKILAKRLNGLYYKTPSEIFDKTREEIDRSGYIDARFFYYLSATLFASNEIMELLKKSPIVCDRYLYSTLAYHKAMGIDLSCISLDKISFLKPDFCFYLYTKEIIRKKRVEERGSQSIASDKFDNDRDLQEKTSKEYSSFPMTLIDVSLATPDCICDNIIKIIAGQRGYLLTNDTILCGIVEEAKCTTF